MAQINDPINTLNIKRNAGYTAFLLGFNTEDRYYEGDSKCPPLSLRLSVAAKFPDHDVGYYSLSTGLMPLNRPDSKKESAFPTSSCQEHPLEPLNQGLRILRSGEKRILIVDFIGFIAPNATEEMIHPDTLRIMENLARVGQDDELRNLDSFVVGINYSKGIHEIIRRNWFSINIPLPDEESRWAYYQFLSSKKGFAKIDSGITKEEFLSLSRGCRHRDIENIMRQAHSEKRNVTRDDFNAVREASLKALVGDMLVIRQPSGVTFDKIYGMDSLKSFVRTVVKAVKGGRLALAPSGFLLQGPPGTGKTFVVDAIASEYGYTIVEWRNTKSQWLGQSESNFETVLQAIESLSPVLVFIDEADQILSQRQEGQSGDSGTGAYMFGRLLNFMGDGRHKGKIVFILASNRPDLIDPALADRIGCSVPLIRPGKPSIPGILASLAGQMGVKINISETEMQEIVAKLPNEASIRKLKDLIGFAALNLDNDTINAKNLSFAAENILFSEDKLKADYWTCLSVRMATYSSLLPWMNGKNVIPENVPSCLGDIVDPKTGSFDSAILDKHIYELSNMIGV
jgi:SpoVK/Ycf46/Vps4 family AAA+-type ATPase